MTEELNVTSQTLAEFCAELIENKMGENVSVMDLKKVSQVADYFVLCTGNSNPHLNALTEWIKRKVRDEYNIRPLAIDGTPGSEWVVIDFGNVIIHILSLEAREKYKLEELWGDAEKLEKLLSERLNEI